MFHQLIRKRAEDGGILENLDDIDLPTLTEDLVGNSYQSGGYESDRDWFAVPGMYGGFAYKLVFDEGEYKLLTESWCRVVEGSGQSHEITTSGITLTDEGFV